MKAAAWRHIAATVVLSALALFAFTATAWGQVYTPTPPSFVLELSTKTPDPGGTFTARGCGFAPGTPITVTIGGRQVSTITAGPDGCGFTSLVAPSDPGTYTVCFTGLTPAGTTQQLCDTITVRVAGAASPVPAAQLPFTGSQNLLKVVALGVILVLAGGIVLIAVQRRTEQE
jgi:hypothetical protein